MSSSNEFQVGVAWRDISPPQPQFLRPTGMGRLQRTRGVLDPLRVEAMAIRAGGELAFLTTSDLRVIWYEWMQEIAGAVARKTGCDPKKLLFSSVHNHSSSPAPENDSAEAKAAVQEANRKIIDGFIGACLEAADRLAPAEIAAATAHVTEPVGQNRRSRFSNGTCANCWASGPVIPPGMKYAGPAGPDSTKADILCARRVGEEVPFAVLVSYASHPHLSRMPYFSGEFPGAVKRQIEAAIPGAVALHTTHASGDIDLHCVHPVPDGEAEELQWFQRSAALLAQRLTRAVLPAIPRSGYFRPRVLRHRYYCSEFVKASHPGPRILINALAMNDIAVASIPCELFLELGLRIQAGSPFSRTLLMSYDGSAGEYMPSPLGFEQGSYEVGHGPRPPAREEKVRKTGIWVEPGTGQEIVAKALEALRDIY